MTERCLHGRHRRRHRRRGRHRARHPRAARLSGRRAAPAGERPLARRAARLQRVRRTRSAELSADAFAGVDLAFFAAGGAVSQEFVPVAVAAGAVAIDKSSAFRGDPDVPLVVPEVNADRPRLATRASSPRPTARPSRWWSPSSRSTTPPASSASWCPPTSRSRAAASAASTSSNAQARAWAAGDRARAGLLSAPHRLQPAAPHRRLPARRLHQRGAEDGRRDGQDLRRPADQGHRHLRARAGLRRALRGGQRADPRPLGAAAARELLAAAPGIEVVDDPAAAVYPTPLDAEGNDPVYVGRIRDDDTAPNCLNFWVVADNLRKGAALNAVQIAEALVERRAAVSAARVGESGHWRERAAARARRATTSTSPSWAPARAA